MEITEVRVKLVGSDSDRLKAFCSITLDGDFVIRDLKVIDGVNGEFVAMPSRKLADRCRRCGCKNHLRAKYCNECGTELPAVRAGRNLRSRTKLHADVAHPINSECRARIQSAVVEAYHEEMERAKEPGYEPADLDEDFDYDDDLSSGEFAAVESSDSDEGESDYDSLIADLKREAADRRASRSAAESTFSPSDSRPGENERDHRTGRSDSRSRDSQPRQRGRRRPRGRSRSEEHEPETRPSRHVESTAPEAPSEAPEPQAPAESDLVSSPSQEQEQDPLAGFGAGIL